MRHQLSRPVAHRTQSCFDLLKCFGQALFPQDLHADGLSPAAPSATSDKAPRGLPQTQQQKAKGWLDRMLMSRKPTSLIHVYHIDKMNPCERIFRILNRFWLNPIDRMNTGESASSKRRRRDMRRLIVFVFFPCRLPKFREFAVLLCRGKWMLQYESNRLHGTEGSRSQRRSAGRYY